jgi:hypothetical protein
MNSLFGKILLWFWAALVINTVGSALITGLSGPRPYLLSRLIAFQLEEARTAYETGGRPGLEQFMQRFHSVFGGEGILTDGSGRDVLTGADESGLLGRSREESRFPAFQLRGAAIARNSADGKFWFIFVISHARLGYWFGLRILVRQADEACVLILVQNVQFAKVFAIKAIGIHRHPDECLLRIHIRGVAFEKAGPLQCTDSLIHGLNDFFLAGEMVVNHARAGSRALRNKRHGGFMKTSLHHHVEHRVENGVPLVGLCFGPHAFHSSIPGPDRSDVGSTRRPPAI